MVLTVNAILNIFRIKELQYNVILLTGCGEISINSTFRITGGKVTEPHAYPFQALILRHNVTDNRYIRPEENDFCGGSVINNMYILTAAHCVHM